MPDIVVGGELAPPNSDGYHGGTAGDEVAALVSLLLGVRLRVAGTAQLSGIHTDEPARPPIHLEVPPLSHPGRPGREHVPAALHRTADLGQLERLASFPLLEERTQIELVRAARAYATGLWWSNEDQNQAWLHLVTAAEIAAGSRQDLRASAQELVRELWPDVWTALEGSDDAVRAEVTRLLAPQIRATRKFVDFLDDCAPDPPQPRPAFDDLDWTRIRIHAAVIYRHRSAALHGGKPFPLPMLRLPRQETEGGVQEIPGGLNHGGLGGIWSSDEAPMLLSTFEHIVRGSLLRWWGELAES